MAEPVFRWGMQPGKAPAPQVVSGVASSPIPSGGGDSLLSSLARLAGIGFGVYDRFFGPEKEAYETLNQQRELAMQQTREQMAQGREDQREKDFQGRVTRVTGQPFTPEVGAPFQATREAMQPGPKIGPTVGPGPVGPSGTQAGGGTGPGGTPGLVARPWAPNLAEIEAKDREAGVTKTLAALQTYPKTPERDALEAEIKGGVYLTPSQLRERITGRATSDKATSEANVQRETAGAQIETAKLGPGQVRAATEASQAATAASIASREKAARMEPLEKARIEADTAHQQAATEYQKFQLSGVGAAPGSPAALALETARSNMETAKLNREIATNTLNNAKKVQGAIDRYQASGGTDMAALTEALAYSNGGAAEILRMDRLEAEALRRTLDQVGDGRAKFIASMTSGKVDEMGLRGELESLNRLEILAAEQGRQKFVQLSTLKPGEKGTWYGAYPPTYRPIVVPIEVAKKLVAGQLTREEIQGLVKPTPGGAQEVKPGGAELPTARMGKVEQEQRAAIEAGSEKAETEAQARQRLKENAAHVRSIYIARRAGEMGKTPVQLTPEELNKIKKDFDEQQLEETRAARQGVVESGKKVEEANAEALRLREEQRKKGYK